jgi:DNA repair photolyase
MAKWKKVQITDERGRVVEADAPIIISASRSTDIPAFYSDWLIERVKKGFVTWTNPFTGKASYVSFQDARLFVFWTKNPKPMLDKLDFFDKQNYHYYFQFTLNDYETEHLEPGVPKIEQRIKTFIDLARHIGKKRVIWRFDPLLLTNNISVDDLLKKVERVGNDLAQHTTRLVFSFCDIANYTKVAKNLSNAGVRAREFRVDEMHAFAKGLSALNKKWGLDLGTCAEKIDLKNYGIEHNRCIDDRLIAREFRDDIRLMNFLGISPQPKQLELLQDAHSQPYPQELSTKQKSLKDTGQRQACGCIISKDIGEYNTCPHLCVYCYANASRDTVHTNFQLHQRNPHAPSIRGRG